MRSDNRRGAVAMENDAFLGSRARLTPGNAVAAIIIVDKERYLMQLRDFRPDIFFPGHWGCFGGALEPGESERDALRRELAEELGDVLDDAAARYFTRFDFDFGFAGHGMIRRSYYEISIASGLLPQMSLGEGRQMRPFSAEDLLVAERTTPYDAHAVWMHAQWARLCPAGETPDTLAGRPRGSRRR